MWCPNPPFTLNRRVRRDRREKIFSARSALSAVCICVLLSVRASAQSVARFSLESVVAVDEFGGQNASNRPQVIIDVSWAVRVGDHWQAIVRPWFRLPRPSPPTAPVPDWDTQLYQAGLRYERNASL